jgi:hypothetical protein
MQAQERGRAPKEAEMADRQILPTIHRATTTLLLLALSNFAAAAEFVVSTDSPSGPGSLLEAVQLAEGAMGPDTIRFDADFFGSARTIVLDEDLAIRDELQIIGPGRDLLSIQPARLQFLVVPGNAPAQVLIENLAMVARPGADYRLIFSNQNLSLRSVDLLGSGEMISTFGAAIFVRDAELSLEEVVLQDFLAADAGGAVASLITTEIHPSFGAPVTVERTAFRGNMTGRTGGALYISVSDSVSETAPVLIRDSEFSDNIAGSTGGAIHSNGVSSFTVINSTFGGNKAEEATIHLENDRVASGVANIDSTTISGNSAVARTGGVFVGGALPPTLRLSNSVVAANTVESQSGNYGNDLLVDGPLVTSYSLIGGKAGANPRLSFEEHQAAIGTTLIDTDPMLGPLANNGGPTQTFAVRSASPLLDAGDTSAPTRDQSLPLPSTDQRGAGFARVSGTGLDIGAYELQVSSGGSGGGSGSSGGGGSIGLWTLAGLAILAILAMATRRRRLRANRPIHRIPVVLVGVLCLSAFRSTLVEGHIDPDFAGYRFDTVVVRIDGGGLHFREIVEQRLQKELAKKGIKMYVFSDLFPRTRSWTPGDIRAVYERHGVDASLAIAMGNTSYSESPGMVLYDATSFGGTTVGSAMIVRGVRDQTSFDIRLIDVGTERVAWLGQLDTRGHGTLFVGYKSTAKGLVKGLAKEWQAIGYL